MENETLEAKLRNQLSPIYGLVDMILLMEEKPEIKELLIKQAKQAVKNKKIIDLLLAGIEAKTLNKPDVMRRAFVAGQLNIIGGTGQGTTDEGDFDDWLQKPFA